MIASVQNPLVKHIVKLRENKHYREKTGTVLVTGYKLVKELSAHTKPKRVFTIGEIQTPPCDEVYAVSQAVLKKITGLPSPEPIAAEFLLPQPDSLVSVAPLLVLDAIRDPGNLGTLIRTAYALGWGGVFLLPTCVDPFHEKVIRASRGTLFRFPWRSGDWKELQVLKKNNALTSYIADKKGTPLSSLKPDRHVMLLLSNEAQGVSDEARQMGIPITIPMEGNMESLNVAAAGAILMYSLKKYE